MNIMNTWILIINLEILAFAGQLGKVVQRDIARRPGVVEATVGVFFDDDDIIRICIRIAGWVFIGKWRVAWFAGSTSTKVQKPPNADGLDGFRH